uniref:Uncharacterized protein n=1 Tax=Anopheles atroparvus TaxID=41427 RepID=A0A182J5H6_ANOAO
LTTLNTASVCKQRKKIIYFPVELRIYRFCSALKIIKDLLKYRLSFINQCLFFQRLKPRGITVFVLHPGNMVSSALSRNWWFYRFLFGLVRPFTKSLQQAASTTIYCATAHELTGLTALYFNNCYVCDPSAASKNEALQQSLWELSDKMIKRVIGESP